MMQPSEDQAEHDQLPDVEEYKASIGHISKVDRTVGGFRNARSKERRMDPNGIYRESLAFTQDVEMDEKYYDWHEESDVSQPIPSLEKEQHHEKPDSPCFWKSCSIISIILLVTIIAVSLVFAASPKDASGFYDWIQGDTDEYASVRIYVSQVRGISHTDAFMDTASPQYLAAQWMAHGDGQKLPVPETQDPTFDERYVMAVLYFTFGGQKWENQLGFLGDDHICTWYQEFTVQSSSSGVDQSNDVLYGVHGCKEGEEGDGLYPHTLYLPNSGLVGSIPNEIRWLERMETLNLEFNGGLIGTLPPGLWKMQSLTQLVLQWCNLEGTIPPWIGEMTNLEYLGLGNNQFTGVVPTEIGNLVRLELLGLDDNVLDGDIEILSPLSNLKSLYLENNYLVGTLSEVLMMSWPNLEELDISGCLLTGELPPNFFNHQNNLRVIDLHANGIKGPLPDGINENSKLEFLALHENVLSGMIPESLTSFKLLRHLDLSRNSFTATLPERLGEMTNLEYLFVGNNNYTTWEIPKFLIELTYLRELSMKDSHLTGTIPEFIGYLSNLEFLDFHHNALMDEIPSNLGQLTKLRHLILKMNMLRGTIPTTFAGLSDLDLLLLEQNDFQGDIEVICSSDIMTVDTFVADCGKGGNISCSCCSQCCDPGDALCNDWEWKGNLDPIWEYGYRRRRYSYNLGPVTWVP